MFLRENNLQEFLEKLSGIINEFLELKILRHLEIEECQEILIPLLFSGETPSGSKGFFIEVYKGNLIPFITKPILQCSFEPNHSLIGCRVKAENDLILEEVLSKLLEIVKTVGGAESGQTKKTLYVLCRNNVLLSLTIPTKS